MPETSKLIIVGANKCGTTSMFRYLSDHPVVCGSARKESHFFDRDINCEDPSQIDAYLANFPARNENHKVLLEATPNYLDGGQVIADRIRSVLEDPQIVVMLRNPVDRLISYFKSKQGWADSPANGISFTEFTDQALSARARAREDLDSVAAEFRLQIRKGEYGKPLRDYIYTFAEKNVLVIFFDSFRSDPGRCLRQVCDFAGLSADFYKGYDFRIENRSRYHRSGYLRTLGGRANLMLEPMLNRIPWLRRILVRAYNLANVTTVKTFDIDEASIAGLENHFAPYNRELRELLTTHKMAVELPDWLSR